MSDNETISDIIGEMLGAKTEFPFVYLMGEPDTPEVIDFKTKEIIEPRKINIRRVTVKELADRLEAALKRERKASGNTAKLREAMDYLCERMADMDATFDPSEVECLRAALAAPPRNCDVGTAEEQDERFHRFCVMQRKGSCAGCPDPVGGRTVANGIRECALIWAQMPFEEGDAK